MSRRPLFPPSPAPWGARVRAYTVVGMLALALAGACTGGGTSTEAPVPPAARVRGAVEAARACRMWAEVIDRATKANPGADVLDAQSAAIATVASKAADDDPRWGALSTDVAGANDFASAALSDIAARITADCKVVPASADKAAAAESDPFSTTSTTPTTASDTTTTTSTTSSRP